jgi:type IV pilus assembly protein PilO
MRFGFRELIFVIAMFGLLGSSYLLVFQKSAAKRAQLQADYEAKQRALANLSHATAGVENLGAKIDELQKAIAFFESKLPKEKEVDIILREIWQMAEANSLQTRTVKTPRSERATGYSEQTIQMSLSGDFRGFYSFLLALEKLPRITRVTTMELKKIDQQDGAMTAEVTLSIFFEPDTAVGSIQ